MPYAHECPITAQSLGLRPLRLPGVRARNLFGIDRLWGVFGVQGVLAHLLAPDPRLDQPVRPKPATESSQFAYWLVDQVELMPRLQRPVATWLLDIDGVINVDRPPRYGWGRYEHTVIPAFEGLAWPVCYSPMFVRILNTLHEKRIVSFRWLTTWEHDGPKKFAPLVGLDIGAWVAAEDDGDTRRWWKLRAFEQTEEEIEHLLIWTDDDMHDFRESLQVVDFLSEDVALAICPDSKQGLMPAEFNRILMGLKMWPR